MINIIDLRSRLFPVVIAVTCLLATTGCVSTNLTPISVQGAAYQPLEDELDLWQTARDEERLLLSEVAIYDDPDLQRYLEQLVERLQSPGMAANREVRFRVTILDDSTLNAFAYPHGSIYVTSGLLAQVETEDQIAGILAHEMTHVENRHMARHERARWNRMVPIGILTVATSLVLSIEEEDAWEDGDYEEAELLGELSEAVFFAGFALAESVSAKGYGHRLELEADEGMIGKLRANHYDVGSVMSFYNRLDGLADFGDGQLTLAHGLGSDAAQRLRKLMRSADPMDDATTAEPLMTTSDLTRLLPDTKN